MPCKVAGKDICENSPDRFLLCARQNVTQKVPIGRSRGRAGMQAFLCLSGLSSSLWLTLTKPASVYEYKGKPGHLHPLWDRLFLSIE